MNRHEDDERRTDEAWRDIIAHYGERATLDEPSAPTPVVDLPDPTPYDEGLADEVDEEPLDRVPESERFVPPPPPPLPRPLTWQRGVAWGGLVLAPLLWLVLAVFNVWLPPVVGLGLIGWFVGGFVYLVATMPKGPREPWDDGSRV